MSRIYLDNAATSWPKPPAVAQAMSTFLEEIGGSAGRSGHASALAAQEVVERARLLAAQLIDAEDASRVAMMFNGTDALNAAIHGVLRPGDHIVTTVCEHNSVLRPLHAATQQLGCDVTLVDCDDAGQIDAERLLSSVRTDTRLVAMTHASNVTGALQPVGEVSAALLNTPTLVLADAAQTVGHLPISVRALGVDLLAAAGHKGMLGPTGTGLLYVRPGVEREIAPLRQGGTGGRSETPHQPTDMPTLLECGNANAVGLAGLAAGLRHVMSIGIDSLRQHEQALTERLLAGLRDVAGGRVLGPADASGRVGVVSIVLDGYDPHELAAILEMTAGIECRAGLHCAPEMHRRMGTLAGGALRLSVGYATTESDIDAAVKALQLVSAEA